MLDSVDPLPPEFLLNPRCTPLPPALTAIEVKAVKVDLGKAAKDPREDVVVGANFFPYVSVGHFGIFLQGASFCDQYAYHFL